MLTNRHSYRPQWAFTCSALFCLQLTLSHAAPLSLDEAVLRAHAVNPALQARMHQAESAAARIDLAGALPDPKAQFTYFGESVQTRTGPQEAIYSISQTIPWWSKLHTREAMASHDAAASAQLGQIEQLHLTEAVTQAYTEAAYLQEAVQTMEAELVWIDDARLMVEEQVRAGDSLNALLRLEVERERTEDKLEQYRQAQFTQRTRLAALLGSEEDSLGPLGELPAPAEAPQHAQSLQEMLLSQNPELQFLQHQIRSADSKVALSRLDRYPDFTLGINYIQVGDHGVTSQDAGRDPWNVTIAVNLPIWEGKNRAAIRAAQASERSSEQRFHNRRLELKAELSATLAARADSQRRMTRYRDSLIPLAEQALDNTQSAYESGQVSVLEVIDSERTLLDLRLNYRRALAQTLQADARLNRLTGVPMVKTVETSDQ